MANPKPCPCCGGEAELVDEAVEFHLHGYYRKCYVFCKACYMGSGISHTPEEALAAWNRRADGWISVEDRLPEEGQTVRAWIEWEKEEVQAKVDNGKWRWWGLDMFDRMDWIGMTTDPTHWRPLPEGPEHE